jgi:ATP-dependent DNA helicase RecQ
MTDDILSILQLAPADVPQLPSRARTTLIAYLLRWQHYDAAQRCLNQLLVTHSHLLSVYDDLARAYLGLDQPDRALEILGRRHALRASNSSQALEARAHLRAGDLAAAQAITSQLTTEHSDLLLTWDLQAEVCQATGDLDDAEAALEQRDTLRPEAVATAVGLARLWQARGDAGKALLWARTALSRTERDERRPSPDLLRLLEGLYRATGQPAQAEATAARLREQHQQELDGLRQALGATVPGTQPRPASRPAAKVADLPTAEPAHVPAAVELTAQERVDLGAALHRHFPHDDFRPGQAEVIAAVLRGESVLAVMPTGAGKSLCYQLAALLLPRTTLVISPLIALMKDQIDGLPAAVAARATTLNSTLDGSELDARLARAAEGGYKLLYAAPERLRQRPFLHALKRAGVSLLVVDEAHCVSLWGHDFRPDYRFIAKAWHDLDRPPILGMTATATPRVRDDVRATLGQMRLVAADVHRANLRLEARSFANDSEKQRALLALCQEIEGSGIVYVNARQKCEDLAAMLRRRRVSAIHYHAGIEDRAAAQDRFMSGQARVVVATVAFGMGVDKADVRFIIHYHPPRALENYYQEAGRAGRDGLPARCILFHAPSDKGNLTRWTRQDALHVDFLRDAYGAVRRRLGTEDVGLISVGDLERDLGAEETHLRVAIHFLETAGLLWRGFDLPRTATLTVGQPPARAQEAILPDGGRFARFVEAARLLPGQTVSRDLLALSREAGLDARTVEAQLLAWEDAGWLSYRGIGRDLLVALPEPPADSRERVAALLADYLAGQDGRIAEMMAYATTGLCRHGHISAYFGGRPIERCESCDNCLGQGAQIPKSTPAQARAAAQAKPVPRTQPSPAVAASGDPATLILQGVGQLPFPLGRTGLARALKGLPTSPVQADRFSLFGALAGWPHKRIVELATELAERGLLATVEKGPYRLLCLTDEGKAWLKIPPQDRSPVITAASQPTTDLVQDYDKVLFQELRSWRLEAAQKIGKPPYVVFPDDALKRIAARRPTSLEELAAIKGVGPQRLERYGQAVLSLISRETQTGRDPRRD